MPSKASQQDWDAFVAAAQQSQFAERVDVSREVQKRLRTWAVDNSLCQPGVAIPAEGYSAIIAQFIGAGSNLQRTKTAEEIAAEAAEQKLAEDRRRAGVVNYEDKPARKMTDEYVNRDPIAERNAATDAALQAKQNPMLTRREQMDNLLARMDPANIPGLVDESFPGCSVYTNGRVNHYKTQQAQEVAKQRNAEVRARYAEQQAAAEVAASQKKGI